MPFFPIQTKHHLETQAFRFGALVLRRRLVPTNRGGDWEGSYDLEQFFSYGVHMLLDTHNLI